MPNDPSLHIDPDHDLADYLARVAAGLAAARLIDRAGEPELGEESAGDHAAQRARALHEITEAARCVRAAAATLDEEAGDRLAWALHTHGGMSQDQVARTLGYGIPGSGRRSVRAVQLRLGREKQRRLIDTAISLWQAVTTGPVSRVEIPPAPPTVDAAASAAAVARLYATTEAAAAAEPADPLAVSRTAEALAELVELWGKAGARMLTDLGHRAHLAAYPNSPEEQP